MLENSRYELKFVTYDVNYFLIKHWIKMSQHNFFREYENRIVNNIYFDSLNFKSFSDNVDGQSKRVKTRYRWYGKFEKQSYGNMEFKIKRNVFGYKKTYNVKDLIIDEKKDFRYINNKIFNELPQDIGIFFKQNDNPQIINQYEREYFKTKNQKFRVTIDRNIKIFDQRKSNTPNISRKTISQNYIVLEIKFDRKSRKDIEDLISNIPIRISKNSKYINAFRSVYGI
jgi:hypothetical protein|tara:strand:+ start:415 stop:1095 length:681 start_codon:yes stop_codon:yes gene_type:complete